MVSVKIKLHFCMRLLKRYACEKYIFASGYVKGTHAKNEPIFACSLLKVPHTKIDYLHRCFFSSLFPLRHIKIFTSPLNLLLSPLSLFLSLPLLSLSLPLLSSSDRTVGGLRWWRRRLHLLPRWATKPPSRRRHGLHLLHRLATSDGPNADEEAGESGWEGGVAMGARHSGWRVPWQAGWRRNSSTSSSTAPFRVDLAAGPPHVHEFGNGTTDLARATARAVVAAGGHLNTTADEEVPRSQRLHILHRQATPPPLSRADPMVAWRIQQRRRREARRRGLAGLEVGFFLEILFYLSRSFIFAYGRYNHPYAKIGLSHAGAPPARMEKTLFLLTFWCKRLA